MTSTKIVAVITVIFAGMLCVIALSIFSSSSNLPKSSPASPHTGFQITSCWFSVPATRQVICGWLNTPESRGRFQLPVVIFRKDTGLQSESSSLINPDNTDTSPLIYLSGGPGGAVGLASEEIEDWYYWYDEFDLNRDLILVDQRGVGLSQPMWDCQPYRDWLRRAWQKNNTLQTDSADAFEVVSKCLESASKNGMQPEWFSSTQSALDMALLMQELTSIDLLGYKSWHVLGVSHGTRIALEWARTNREGIQSLVLDSVYPLDEGVLSDWPQRLNESFENLWAICAIDSMCIEPLSPTEVKEKFWAAIQILEERPVSLVVDSWHGDWPYNLVVNDYRYLNAVYLAMYNRSNYPEVLKSMDEIITAKDYSATGRILEQSVNSEIDTGFNLLVYFTTECSETPLLEKDSFEAVRQQYDTWLAYTEQDWSIDICQRIDKRVDIEAFREPVSTQIPALILAGGLDPVTPLSWAEKLNSRQTNSQLLPVPESGHGVLSSGYCRDELLIFLLNPVKNLADSCVN